ncbi:MAG: LCP family protein [Alicyclobacillaceae bacterium]|nr:LCP family protein [Alicyclobacillaceae bacterium]
MSGIRWGKWTKRLLALILLTCLAGAGYYGVGLAQFVMGIGDSALPGAWPSGDVRILLLGVDNRGNDLHPRSDTMLLLNIPQDGRAATAASILRDTWVSIPGVGKEKINAAYAQGGPDLARRTVEDWLGMDVPFYAVTDFEGFIHVVDALGGVDIDVEKPMDYVDDGKYDIHLKPGLQHLNGAQALGYVRFRHDALGDYARTERQRKFVLAVVKQIRKPQNLLRMPLILREVQPYIRTNLSSVDLLRLGWHLWRDQSHGMELVQLPPSEAFREGRSADGQSILLPDTLRVRAYVRSHFAGPSAQGGLDEGVVTGEWVNVRTGPGTTYPVIGRLTRGTTFEVLEKLDGWVRVRISDGREGYVSLDYVQVPDSP